MDKPIEKYIAFKTGEPDYHQIYKFVEEKSDGRLLYENYNWKFIYKNKLACEEAIAELAKGGGDGDTALHSSQAAHKWLHYD